MWSDFGIIFPAMFISQVEHPLHHTGVVHVYGEAHRCGKIKLGEGHFVLKVNPGVLIMVK